jgi:hypothetical protein
MSNDAYSKILEMALFYKDHGIHMNDIPRDVYMFIYTVYFSSTLKLGRNHQWFPGETVPTAFQVLCEYRPTHTFIN